MIKRIFAILTAVVASIAVSGQNPFGSDPDKTIAWSGSAAALEQEGLYEAVFEGVINEGLHTYDLKDEYSSTTLSFTVPEGMELVGEPYLLCESEADGTISGTIKVGQKVQTADGGVLGVKINWICCSDNNCSPMGEWESEVTVGTPVVQEAPVQEAPAKGNSGLWGLILEAILWGFAMLLTPCVFPMVPMTVSYFIKGSGNPALGRFKAAMYGLFIVLLYTVPISLIILITWIAGGSSVTSDIFQWLATHWLPNIIFFVVFMIFAASFFGAFEITLPSSMVNKSDRNSDKKGLAGVFFMALTLVLVSFSCTGPIVGTVLIKSTQGEFWTPMVTMLAFSVAFALPFTILALFPSLLKKLPKSGGWLNSVKVVLGFIEIALGFKFLSTADQTYHWGILDREVYLAIWIATFSLLGMYLLGKIRFKNDSPMEYLSVKRLALAIGVFSFVIYLIPGMWGAPLKALSGYLPPIETQDFVLSGEVGAVQQVAAPQAGKVKMPHGLYGYDNIDDALVESQMTGKPVFVDISGLGCVNCREMEARVWSDPEVLSILRDDYVLVLLYTDDKTPLPESEWVAAEGGKVLKEVGRVNSWIARERFGVGAQPNYALLGADGRMLVPVRGYDLDVDGFVAFLRSGLEKY